MTVFVTLIRGINVGGNKTIRMSELKSLLEGLGLADVKTLLNSGNAVFAACEKNRAKLTTSSRRRKSTGRTLPTEVEQATRRSE